MRSEEVIRNEIEMYGEEISRSPTLMSAELLLDIREILLEFAKASGLEATFGAMEKALTELDEEGKL